MLKRRPLKISAPAILAAFSIYVWVYVILSLRGQYVPAAWGLGWVKWYNWAPRGFVSGPEGIQQNRTIETLFLPLWSFDMRFIHTSAKAGCGRYPVNTTLDDQLRGWLEKYKENQSPQGPEPSHSTEKTNRTSAAPVSGR